MRYSDASLDALLINKEAPGVVECLVALGSNLGDRQATASRAIEQLTQTPSVERLVVSSLYETPPIGGKPGHGAFLNGVARFATTSEPLVLFERLLEIERLENRHREVRWAPRTLDLDLLAYGDQILRLPSLRVPHPRMTFRDFVLRGACEVAPDWKHPELGRTFAELRQTLHQGWNGVQVLGNTPGIAILVRTELRLLSHGLAKVPVVEVPQKTPGRLVLDTDIPHRTRKSGSPTLCFSDCQPSEWRSEVRAALESVWLTGDNP